MICRLNQNFKYLNKTIDKRSVGKKLYFRYHKPWVNSTKGFMSVCFFMSLDSYFMKIHKDEV